MLVEAQLAYCPFNYNFTKRLTLNNNGLSRQFQHPEPKAWEQFRNSGISNTRDNRAKYGNNSGTVNGQNIELSTGYAEVQT